MEKDGKLAIGEGNLTRILPRPTHKPILLFAGSLGFRDELLVLGFDFAGQQLLGHKKHKKPQKLKAPQTNCCLRQVWSRLPNTTRCKSTPGGGRRNSGYAKLENII